MAMDALQQEIFLLKEKYDSLVIRLKKLSLENREQHNFISSVLDDAPFGFLIFDIDRKVTKLNKTASKLFGVSQNLLIGTPCDKLFECFQQESQCPVLDQQKNIQQEEISGVAESDEAKFFLRNCKSNTEQGVTLIVETFVDITEEKRSHERFLEAYKMKESFLARINHEIRTPLNGIIGLSELLRAEQEDGVPSGADTAQSLDEVIKAGYRLKDIFDKLLYYNEMSNDAISLQPKELDVVDLIDKVAQASIAKTATDKQRLEIRIADDVSVIDSDEEFLSNILLELLANAICFDTQGQIILSVKKDIYNNIPWFSFEVRDQGEGIAPERLEYIFDDFEQAEDFVTRQHGGTGIGLSLAKRHASLLGGDITVNSEEGVGSVFTLRIPSRNNVD